MSTEAPQLSENQIIEFKLTDGGITFDSIIAERSATQKAIATFEKDNKKTIEALEQATKLYKE